MKRVLLQDLSEQLGLSKTLISMVINGKADRYGISKNTQEKVLEAIEKSNYFKFEEDVHTSSEDIPMLATEAERRGKRRRRLLTGGQGPIL